jgi:DNA-directed RNA polymerase subunit RPC12/RpoP
MDSMQDYNTNDDDDDKKAKTKSGKAIKDWDCPTCEANNPTDEPIKSGEELRCNYCGNEFLVSFSDTGKMKFKEL